ncbi:hypothetical protein ACP70R_018614 [Stipagrostis hirtigluma subsp. patula]
MLLRLSQVPNLVVSSPRAAEAVLRAHDHVFASRPPSAVSAVLHSGSSDVAMAPYGEYWRQARKFVTAHLLSAKKVQSLRRAREEQVRLVCSPRSTTPRPPDYGLSLQPGASKATRCHDTSARRSLTRAPLLAAQLTASAATASSVDAAAALLNISISAREQVMATPGLLDALTAALRTDAAHHAAATVHSLLCVEAYRATVGASRPLLAALVALLCASPSTRATKDALKALFGVAPKSNQIQSNWVQKEKNPMLDITDSNPTSN